jgi:hypothetical protein
MFPAMALAGALIGCSGTGERPPTSFPDMQSALDAASPADVGGNDGFVSAPHTPYPQLAKHTGVVLNPVKLVTITFANDSNRATAEMLGDYLVGSPWMKEIIASYGVASATHLAKVELTTSAPSTPTSSSLVSSLWQWIGDGTIPSDPNAFYMVYYPRGTTFDSSPLSPGILCTNGVSAYHWNAESNGKAIAYGVFVDCGPNWYPPSYAVSHELAEAATDPYGNYQNGYFLDVASPNPWFAQSGFWGENADLCEHLPIYVENGWSLSRVWSNAAVAAGANPCVPSDGMDAYGVGADPTAMPTVAAGSQISFSITGWSSTARAEWTLTTARAHKSALSLSQMSPQLSRSTINNGETVTLTLTVPSTATTNTIGSVLVISAPGLIWPVGFIVK